MADSFRMKIGNVCFEVRPMHSLIGEMSTQFLCADQPEQIIAVAQKDIEFEREMCSRADRYLKIDSREYTDARLETFAVLRKTAEILPFYQSFYMHASAISVDGQGILFAAESRGGKSTHAALWSELLKDRVTVINDDKPILTLKSHGVFVSGSPWAGKRGLTANLQVPVRAICFLKKSPENAAAPISPIEALPALMHFAHRPYDPENMSRTFSMLDQVSRRVRFYELNVNTQLQAAGIAYAEIMRDLR